jgi:osmotically-inducible protein OsmY
VRRTGPGATIAAAVAVATVVVGCTRTDETAQLVSQTLEQSSIQGVNVSVDREPRLVHLTGTVETLADRTRAGELAAAIAGTRGRVLNEIQVDGLGPVRSARP